MKKIFMILLFVGLLVFAGCSVESADSLVADSNCPNGEIACEESYGCGNFVDLDEDGFCDNGG